MIKGFYNLTSGMLTQQKNLNIVANNLVNISTSGYKEQRYTATTFDDVLYSRVGNKLKDYEAIGRQSYIRATSQVYTNYEQGTPEQTGLALDFAIDGDGFFAVQMADGEIAYTRSGSFSLDEEGYLCLPGVGYVLDPQEQPITLTTDKVNGDSQGRLYTDAGGYLGQVGVFTIEDTEALEHDDRGLFTGAEGTAAENPSVYWGYVERSNVDMVKQMSEMISSQRAFQSAAQVAKLYDSLMSKATTEIGRT